MLDLPEEKPQITQMDADRHPPTHTPGYTTQVFMPPRQK